MPGPGFEPGLLRPQRSVLTTRRSRLTIPLTGFLRCRQQCPFSLIVYFLFTTMFFQGFVHTCQSSFIVRVSNSKAETTILSSTSIFGLVLSLVIINRVMINWRNAKIIINLRDLT